MLNYLKQIFLDIKESYFPSYEWTNKPFSQWTPEDIERFNEKISNIKCEVFPSYDSERGEPAYCLKVLENANEDYIFQSVKRYWFKTKEEAESKKYGVLKLVIINYLSKKHRC